MSKFTTRVELFDTDDGTSQEYTILHDAMSAAGFIRTIKGDNGIEYHLPPAEYNYEGNKTSSEVLGLAKAAANQTKKKNSVLVTESNGRTWDNLTKVNKAVAR